MQEMNRYYNKKGYEADFLKLIRFLCCKIYQSLVH